MKTEVLSAPMLSVKIAELSQWEVERQAFFGMLPELLKVHDGKFVAVSQGRVVAVGDDKIALALEGYNQVGYRPVYVGKVGPNSTEVARVPSPRWV
jgi:hypothetical protein